MSISTEKSAWLLGVCGMGVGPLAVYMCEEGWDISGWDDATDSPMLAFLEKAGVRLTSTPDSDVALVGRSSAVKPGHPLYDLARERANRAMMQFDNNFAMMRGNEVVILCPGKPACAFRYDFKNEQLVPAEISEEAARDALAWVHWGSLAYRESLHKLPKVAIDTVKE